MSASFGYHPDYSDLAAPFAHGAYSRALVLDTPVGVLIDRVRECRVLWDDEVLLPEGVYWFLGIDEPLVLQVRAGHPPGDATVVPVEALGADHPLADAWAWAESLWSRSDVVPPPRFVPDEAAMTVPAGTDVVIRSRKYFAGQWSYTVVIDGRPQDVVESRLTPRPSDEGPLAWVLGEPTRASRFGATLTRAKLQGKFANTLFSFRATRTTFRPYQFKPVLKLLQTGKARLLIADEVGLGKTIEAGLIWTELEARQEADRVLVVCPSNLLGKWTEEMEERFGLELTELDAANLEMFLQRFREGRLPPRQAYICSLERLRTWSGLEELERTAPEFDLVIVDEAHAMRNQDTKSYALGTQIAEWADNLVFLTATPINLRQEDLQHLLELLAPEDYGDASDLELRLEPNRVLNDVAARLVEKHVSGHDLARRLEALRSTVLGGALMGRPDFTLLRDLLDVDQLAPRDVVDAKRYLSDLNTLSTVITRTKKIEVDERKAKRIEDRQTVVWTPSEDAFYEEYLTWCRHRARAQGQALYFAMQMPLRLASACLPMARRAVLDPVSFGEITDADAAVSPVRLDPHPELVLAARQLAEGIDSKFDRLHDVLLRLQAKGRRALLFTFSRPTLAYLAARLGDEFRVATMHGGVRREDRRRIMAEFRRGEYDFLLANRVASEGLDFEFCSAVINYDLPWNPMEIEQRIGRIDRIGQPEETILVVNFVNERTIDERILARVLDRIEIFESSIGALEPIIAASAPAALQAGFDFTLTEREREQRIHEVLMALEEQRLGLKEVADASNALLVSNDVDIAGLEQDLVRTGRYVGQKELALLLDDWALTEGASRLQFADDGETVELRGNPAMAARVEQLARTGKRSRGETSEIASKLRDELPISLVLDQERARTDGGTLLTATSPLVMAATTIPGHRQARFATLRVTTEDPEVEPGTYVAVVARAAEASRGGDEIWGAAVTLTTGTDAGQGPVNALLAALAQAALADASPAIDEVDLGRFAERAMDRLHLRHVREQQRRDREFQALVSARRLVLADQHGRKVRTIEQRRQTALSRGRGARVIELFERQKVRAEQRHARLIAELDAQGQPAIRLEALAACVLEVKRG